MTEMSILDRYIARQYILNTVALLVILFSFVVTVDVAININRFARVASDYAGEDASGVRRVLLTAWVIADLWGPRLLQLFNFLIGLVLVGAMGFTLTQLVRHRELVAVMASGVSLYRVARPVLAVGLFFIGLQLINQELILPRMAPLLSRDTGDAGKRQWDEFQVPLTRDANGNVLWAGAFDPDTSTLAPVHVWVRAEPGEPPSMRITADEATWDGDAWVRADPVGVTLALAETGSTDLDQAHADPPERFETDISPTRLLVRRYQSLRHSLSTAQLTDMVHAADLEPSVRASLERVRFGRFSMAISSLLSLLISLPFFLTRMPTSMLKQSLKCAPVGIGAMVVGVLGASTPIPGLPAAFAVFLPVLILGTVAIATSMSLRT